MTTCGSQLQTPMAVFSCGKEVDENAAHLDGNPLHVEKSKPGDPYREDVEWTDEQAAEAARA